MTSDKVNLTNINHLSFNALLLIIKLVQTNINNFNIYLYEKIKDE